MRDRRVHVGVVCTLLIAAGLAAPGCRVIRKWLRPAERVELAGSEPESQTGGGIDAIENAEFAPESDRSGLEVRLMVVDDTRYDAPRLLNELIVAQQAQTDDTRPVGASTQTDDAIDERVRQRWESWGFRLVLIPQSKVQPFLGALTPVQSGSVQWLGEFGDWRPIVRAGTMGDTSVRVGDSTTRIEGGRPTLIARSWVEPSFTDSGVGSVVRLDLGMQMQQNKARSGSGFFDPTHEPTIEDSGPVLDTLLSSLRLPPGKALVIVAGTPGASWDDLPDPVLIDETTPEPDEREDPDEGIGPRPADASQPAFSPQQEAPQRTPASRRPAFGVSEPQRPALPSLGELMLMTEGSRIIRTNETRVLPKRVIVVLIPRTQGPYRLLPSVTAHAEATP